MTALRDKLRAWWSHQQGLDGRFDGKSAADVLAQTGWARSVGGMGPYLTLFARAGTSREAADRAVEKLEIHELPSARGCTYVLPAADFALGLKAGERDGEMKVAQKLGVTEREIDKLCEAVLKALSKSALDPEQIREATGNVSRSLGEEGKKKGLTTTLPVALGKLQSSGDIRRVPVNGRLDQQRYKYVAWKPNPMAKFKWSPEEVQVELARRYFAWTGPATVAEFRWFSAMSAKAAQAAIEPLKLIDIEDGRLILPAHRDEFESFKIPKQADYILVSSIDGISLLRRDLASIADSPDLKSLGAVPDLPSHGIFDRGRLVGLWEYDPETESIAWASFIAKNKDLTQAVARMEEYVRTQLGDARSFSLDSPKSRAPRIQALQRSWPRIHASKRE